MLQKIIIRNFKGCRSLDLDFGTGEGMYEIAGRNGSGKSTVADAVVWCLIGKNANGDADFSICPIGRDDWDKVGVSVVVNQHIFTREVTKSYSVNKVTREKEYKGLKGTFIVDGAACKKVEYEAAVRDVFAMPENTLYYTIRPSAFFTEANNAARIGIIGNLAQIGGCSFESINQERKTQKQQLKGYQTDIDRAMASLALIPKVDTSDLQKAEADLQKAREVVSTYQSQLAAYKTDTGKEVLLERLRGDIAKANGAKTTAEMMIRREQDDFVVFEQTIKGETDYENAHLEIEYMYKLRALLLDTVDYLRDVYRDYSIRMEDSNLEINKRLGIAIQATVANLNNKIEGADKIKADREKETENRIKARRNEVDAFISAKKADITHQEQVIKDAEARIVELKNAQGMDEQGSKEVEALKVKLAEAEAEAARLTDEVAKLHKVQADNATRAALEETIRNARGRAAMVVERLEELDGMEATMRDGITSTINKLFPTLRFNLFADQVNGGTAMVCTPTIDGVPYADLNTASKVRAQQELVHGLSGGSVFAFIDNAESVLDLPNMSVQTIALRVADCDFNFREV